MIGTYRMKITTLKNENGETVYHVTDDGCIQEFWSYKEAQAFVAYYSPTDWTLSHANKEDA